MVFDTFPLISDIFLKTFFKKFHIQIYSLLIIVLLNLKRFNANVNVIKFTEAWCFIFVKF